MFDPTSPLTAPPPRYLIESDSSDEEGQGLYAGRHENRRTQPAAKVTVHLIAAPTSSTGSALSTTHAIIGIGQAGKYLLRRASLSPPEPLLFVLVDGRRVGAGYSLSGKGLLVVVEESAPASGGDVVQGIVDAVRAESWTLFSSYVPSMYIPSPSERLYDRDPPVRSLSRSPSPTLAGAELKPYDAPNYVTGLAGAFLSQATHPASPIPSNTPVTLLLLPLPLSTLSPSALDGALAAVPAGTLASAFTRHAYWSERDDEPFAGPGMGRRERRDLPSQDLGGMYM